MSDDLDTEVPRIEKLAELEGKYGILLRHIKQIQRYNNRLNWLIMLRPINKDVAGKLHAGSRGKIISIKGKSSEFIFLAGDIPFEAGLSKLGSKGEGSDWGKIEHFNSVNRNSKNDKDKEKKVDELKKKIKEIQKQIELLKSIEYGTEAQLGIQQAQKELKHLTLEHNLQFNLDTIPKIVEIGNKKYESFYELDEKGHPKYEKITYEEKQKDGSFVAKERSEPIVYVREVGKITDGYAKIKYDDSEIGYSIDTDTKTQKEAGNQNIKPIEIFSYEQYEECAISGNKKIRIDNTYGEECEIEGYCTFNDKSGNFYVKAKKEGDNEFKYYLLENPTNLAGQEGIETYNIGEETENIDLTKLVKLETNYELIKPPLTADYDQLSAARVYNGREQINIPNLESAIKYVEQEQNKLISLPPNRYMEECKKAAERLSTGEIYATNNLDIELLSEISEEIAEATDYDTIAQESDILQLKLGLLGCCGESVTKEKLELGEILGYGISHGLEMLHYPPESIRSSTLDELLGNENNKDEEFLVVDGEGNPRIAKNLEGVLFFMNNQRNSGLCCLEPNPLWPIKVNFGISPHIIEVDDMMDSPLLTGGFYTGAVELQKKLRTPSFTDEFIYAERLFLNSDFVPNIKLPNDVEREDIRKIIETKNLRRANEHYEKVLTSLKSLKTKGEQNYSRNFMEFCQQQNLSEYIETKDEIIDIFDLKNKADSEKIKASKVETRKILSNPEYVQKLITLLKNSKGQPLNIESFNKNPFEEKDLEPTIKEHLIKILNDEKIRTMLLSEPDNPDLKAKFFDTLPNINLLKGFEIKQKADFMQMDFMEHLDDYIGFVKERQIQTISRLETIERSTNGKKLNYLKNNYFPNRLIRHREYARNGIIALEELKQNKFDKINGNKANKAVDNKILKEIDSINKKIEFLYKRKESKGAIENIIIKKERIYLNKLENYKKELQKEKNDIEIKLKYKDKTDSRQTLFAPITQEQESAQIKKENEIKESREEERNEIIKRLDDRLQKLKSELVLQEKKIQTWKDKMPSLTKNTPNVFTGSSLSNGRTSTLQPMSETENSNQGINNRAKSTLRNTKIVIPKIKKPVKQKERGRH